MRAMVNIIKYRRPRRLAGVAGCAQISLGCRLPGGWRLEREEDSDGGGEGGGRRLERRNEYQDSVENVVFTEGEGGRVLGVWPPT